MEFESLSEHPEFIGNEYHFVSETHELTATTAQLLAVKNWLAEGSTSEVLNFPEADSQELQNFSIQSRQNTVGGYILQSNDAIIYSDKEYFDNFLARF